MHSRFAHLGSSGHLAVHVDVLSARIAIIGPGKKVRRLATVSSGPSDFTIKCVRNSFTVARAKNCARRYGLSARTVFRWTFEKSRGARPRKLGRALGIDEYSRRKGHRYNTIIVDLDKGRPITTFKGRRVEDVVAWFKSRPQEELDRVEVVVLDMSKTFYSAIEEVFGDQVQVIDRFHVVKQAVDALDSVLRSVQKQLDPRKPKR